MDDDISLLKQSLSDKDILKILKSLVGGFEFYFIVEEGTYAPQQT